MKIPLANKIKKKTHRDLAFVQDKIVEELLKIIPNAVFHGGTCIWRCYQGKRFSEDLDFYFPKNKKLINNLFDILEKKGFEILKKKVSDTRVYSELKYNGVSVRLEATFQKIPGELLDYEKLDGSIITIYGLTTEQLLNEKIKTYLKRKKIRDIYDIFYLLQKINDFSKINNEIEKVFKSGILPEDKGNLPILIFEGIIPDFEKLKNYIKRKWENPNI
jgi:predicted nucleotidyltransferase component of viral defense system